MKRLIIVSIIFVAASAFGSLAAANEIAPGFRARIEADWARQEETRERTIGNSDALADLIDRSEDLLESLRDEDLVDSTRLATFERAIEKASGANTDNFVAVRYEGYGPNAVPVIVEALTDNPRRTVPEIRNIFAKNGGNMGEEGSVVFMFSHVGQIMYPASIGKSEDEMMELVMEVDADNLETSEEGFIITTKPDNFMNIQKALADKLGEPENAEITWVPNMPVDLDDEAYAKIERLVDALDDNDDVQKVFTAAA